MSNQGNPDEAAINALSAKVMAQIPAILDKADKFMTDVQMEKLESHMQAMARRSLTSESLPEFDTSLFDEVSPISKSLAQEVTDLFGNLPVEEALLLSIHFETAQSKN
ncbi:hypothetical protein WJT86_03725 [Microvirga sp. W0021]|uniref:PRD domain-containing protein n=1 Tax=Hohaiivirga grylli TaxID=3133970 RepID=A0ABV0BGU3_9HYPH